MRFQYDPPSITDAHLWPHGNNTTSDQDEYALGFESTQPLFTIGGWKSLALIFTTALIIFTVGGNAMTLYAVCKMKTFQNSISNLYIASLAAADLVVGAFVMTFMMLYTIAYDGRWVFGQVMCDVWQTADFVSCTISLYSICAIGFDRWLNLEKPLRIFKRNRFTAKRALAFVWIAPLIVWTPLLIGFRLRYGPSPQGSCTFVWEPRYVVPLVAVPLFYVPVFTLMILFVRISLVIRSHLVFLHKHSNQSTTGGTSLFDFSAGGGGNGSLFGSTPASSRRRSANPSVHGSAGNLNICKYANGASANNMINNSKYGNGFSAAGNLKFTNGSMLVCNGSTSSLHLNGLSNTPCCRGQKFKPPPLSPIVSVNLVGSNGGQTTTKGDTVVSDSISEQQAATNNLSCSLRSGPPNQSPLAMKVLRDRVSPKKLDLKSKSSSGGGANNNVSQSVDRAPSPVVFCFDTPETEKPKLSIRITGVGDQTPKETTPLLRGHSTESASTGQTTIISSARRLSAHAISASILDLIRPDDEPSDRSTDLQISTGHSPTRPVSFQIGGPPDDTSPGQAPLPQQIVAPPTPQRSVSRESVSEKLGGLVINRNVPSPIADHRVRSPMMIDQKRSSVTSDTAVFFTKRFLQHKPPLLRARTEIVLQTSMRPKPRQSGRFSIISMSSPLFSRKYSMNIFADMFPQCANGITQQIRAAKAVGVILIFFLISWAPFLILWPLKTFCPDCVSENLYHLSIWANYLNSTLNPILYTLCSPRFQRVFRKHCTKCPKRTMSKKKREENGNNKNTGGVANGSSKKLLSLKRDRRL